MKPRHVLFATVMTLLAGAAYAGYYQPFPVDVDLDLSQASGDQYSARADRNKDVLIGCGTRVLDDGVSSFSFGFCQATDAEGDTITCTTLNPSLVDAMSANNTLAFITFSWDPETLDCTRVGFSTQSFYIPEKLLTKKKKRKK